MESNTFTWSFFEDLESNTKIFKRLKEAIALREKHMKEFNEYCDDDIFDFTYDAGLFIPKMKNYKPITIKEFINDGNIILNTVYHKPTISFCYRRLEYLKHNFLMYKNIMTAREKVDQRKNSKKDFYKIVKVDTHIHHSAAMNSKHLLKFIKYKLKNEDDDIVHEKEGEEYKLKDIFKQLNISLDEIRIENIDTHAHTDSYHRFDQFITKFSPYGENVLREIFLKYDNYSKGKYLCELTKQLFKNFEETKYQYYELRISVYGYSKGEWNTLSNWIINNKLLNKHVRWIIQFPRLYHVHKKAKKVENFGEMIQNFFKPLFDVTLDSNKDPNLAKLLQEIGSFDTVDDESLREIKLLEYSPPDKWDFPDNPPYFYYIYYFYYNIKSLNVLRKAKGLNTFSFRPHCGEIGDIDHLVYGFLTSKGISHGIQLRKSFTLQYLYYLTQIGIYMSPLSNNTLFLKINKSPFYDFFLIGLSISLSTDDPLQFHYFKDPLMEEYCVCSQMWKLSSCDQCELARNSVMHSDFSEEQKLKWIGSTEKNEIAKTNVSDYRIFYRENMLKEEQNYILKKNDETK